MASFALDAALAAGVTIVTPNNRLARTLVARHDALMAGAGHRTWTSARALPWHAWLRALWRDATDAGAIAGAPRLLAPVESRFLWERIVAEDAAVRGSLLDPHGAAALAEEAWELVHSWGSGGPSWRAWRGTLDAPAGSDPALFAPWAERYHRELERLGALDSASLADALAEAAPGVPQWRGSEVALAGFLELTPQQERLLGRLRAAGVDVVIVPAPSGASAVHRASADTPREEIRMALTWARARASEPGERLIGIAIEDLAARRDEVRALADEVLCPVLQLPGHADSPRPYSLSLGQPVSDAPVVATALALLALAQHPLASADAAALMRSPFLPGPWSVRAQCELAWLNESRPEIAWDDALACLAQCVPALAARWRAAAELRPRGGTQSPRAWVDRWRAFLAQCGWPGERALQGAEFAARDAWELALEEFARIGNVDARLSAATSLAALRDLAARTIFQPESPPAAIAIMGLLEAAALPFDALWVAGMSAQRWPPAPQPNPLLPLRWQRDRNVPRSSGARELAYARLLTASLAHGAPDVVFSAPAMLDEHASTLSALVAADAPMLGEIAMAPDRARLVAAARAIESLPDPRAPALAPGAIKGGVGVIAAQSDCPFQAAARYRMDAAPWPRAAEGLNYMERGNLVHAAMAAFWRELRTHEALAALPPADLKRRTADAVAQARGVVSAARWRLLPPAVAAAEAARIEGIAVTWLQKCDLPRPPFTVEQVEWPLQLTLAGLTLRMKLDRIDAPQDGGRVIVDYKTGEVDTPTSWFAPRPRAPQLGLYALALQESEAPHDLRAVAYARLKAGEVAAVGIAADDAAWPALTNIAKLRDPSDWSGVEQWWQVNLTALATELREGIATVTPRDNGTPCRHCGLQSLCRIGAMGLTAVGETEEEADGDD